MKDFGLAICCILIFGLLGFNSNSAIEYDIPKYDYEFTIGAGSGTGSGTGSGSGSGTGSGSGGSNTSNTHLQIMIDYHSLMNSGTGGGGGSGSGSGSGGGGDYSWIADTLALDFQKTGECSCERRIEVWTALSVSVDVEETVKKVRTKLDAEGVDGIKYVSRNYDIDNNNPNAGIVDKYDWPRSGDIYLSGYKPDLRIAVIDNGFNDADILFQNRLWDNPYFYDSLLCMNNFEYHGLNTLNIGSAINPNTHATSVGSIISSRIPANAPIELMNIQVKDGNSGGTIYHLVCGIVYAVDNEADIINISMGYTGARSRLLENHFRMASPTMFVTSAGNNGIQGNHWPSRFSSFVRNVISVGSVDFNGVRSDFSNNGNIFAHGQDLADRPTGNLISGTSFATPFVTAAIAEIMLQSKDLRPYYIRKTLLGDKYCNIRNGMKQLRTNTFWVPSFQFGKGNQTFPNPNQNQFTNQILNSYPNPANETTTVTMNLQSDTPVSLTIRDLNGTVVQMPIVNEFKSKGEYQIPISVNRVTPGTYLITIQTSQKVETQKLIVQ